MKRLTSLVVAILALLPASSSADLDSGMALIDLEGRLFVKYLSTGETVDLVADTVFAAGLSPEGTAVAYIVRHESIRNSDLYTVNIDGSGNRLLAQKIGWGGAERPQWCTDGYIHIESGDKFVPETGEFIEKDWTYHVEITGPTGKVLEAGNSWNDFQMSRDGTRAVGTSRITTGGYGMRTIDLVTREQYFWAEPCQSGMSPSGNLLSVSNCGHRCYRIFAWGLPFVEYTDGTNTFSGCPGSTYDELCPDYDTVLHIGRDIQAMYGLASAPEINSPKFLDHEEDIFVFGVVPSDAPEEAVGCYLYDRSSMEYTTLQTGYSHCWGFIREEVRFSNQQSFSLAPSAISFDVQPGQATPDPVAVTVGHPHGTPAAVPVVLGTPGWLSVVSTVSDSTTVTLHVGLNADSVPSQGSYAATMTVVPAGTDDSLSLSVALVVGGQVVAPITIHSPVGGQSVAVGDTLTVRYSADPADIQGVVIKLSLDAGESYTVLNPDSTCLPGSSQLFAFVVPDSLEVFGVPRPSVSDECYLLLTNYPSGDDTRSEQFAIHYLTQRGASTAS